MALPNFVKFNQDRQELMKIKTINEEVVLFTKEEARNALIKYIDEELDFFASGISRQRKIELEEEINSKLGQMEIGLLRHIDDKIEKITERILEATINRKINEEVEKRLEEKLKKIKKLL